MQDKDVQIVITVLKRNYMEKFNIVSKNKNGLLEKDMSDGNFII